MSLHPNPTGDDGDRRDDEYERNFDDIRDGLGDAPLRFYRRGARGRATFEFTRSDGPPVVLGTEAQRPTPPTCGA